MGNICGSPDEKLTNEEKLALKESKAIDTNLGQAGKVEEAIVKVLLLGTGESGKSTIFKQMQIIYEKGFTNTEVSTYKYVLRRNLVESMQSLIRGCMKFKDVYEHENSAASAEFILKLDILSAGFWNPEILDHLRLLWESEAAIQRTFARANEIQVLDSAEYLFTNANRLSSETYEPSQEDILRCRMRTSGIVEHIFHVKGVPFQFLDVGGQRNERRKWVHCFQEVTAIIFVTAISEYDLVLFEDENVNRMDDSIRVFDSIVNHEVFEGTAIILFLNKKDVFAEKIKHSPLSKHFPDYTGGDDYESATGYVQKRFLDVNKTSNTIFPYLTCATDSDNIENMFEACRHKILHDNLDELM